MSIHKNSQIITDDNEDCDNCGEIAWVEAGMVGGVHIAECDNCYATVVDKAGANA